MDKVELVLYQYSKLCRTADDIIALQHKIRRYKDDLLNNWTGPETTGIIRQLDELDFKLGRISGEIIEFGHDYLYVGQEI